MFFFVFLGGVGLGDGLGGGCVGLGLEDGLRMVLGGFCWF